MRRLVFCVLLLISSMVICAAGAGIWLYAYASKPSPGSGTVVVEIPQGAGVRRIGELLEEKHILKNDIRYLMLVRLTGSASHLRAGEFELHYGWTPLQVLHHLEQGKMYYHSLTIPEGTNLEDIVALFASQGWGSGEKFVSFANSEVFCRSLGIEQGSLEGYLFPDTYHLVRGEMDEREILTMMVHRFHKVWNSLSVPSGFAFGRHEVVILASIVEKETGSALERPRIARVFINRLEKGMRLQSDPTVIYGMENFTGDLTRADLRESTPYNTYVVSGLPAGPICNPGKEALSAILHPAESEALYFVSRNDGTHEFSTTLKAHNRAVLKYQKNRKRPK